VISKRGEGQLTVQAFVGQVNNEAFNMLHVYTGKLLDFSQTFQER
jgi:hypothetical protein